MNVGTIVGGATQNSGKSAGMWATSGSDGRAVLHHPIWSSRSCCWCHWVSSMISIDSQVKEKGDIYTDVWDFYGYIITYMSIILERKVKRNQSVWWVPPLKTRVRLNSILVVQLNWCLRSMLLPIWLTTVKDCICCNHQLQELQLSFFTFAVKHYRSFTVGWLIFFTF